MSDVFLLGAGFSKAVCQAMPTMSELYDLLEPLIDVADGFTREAYDYASGNVETLLSHYAIPNPADDPVEVLRKKRVTSLLEIRIGECLRTRENSGFHSGLNPNGEKLVRQWEQQQNHVLTANYDTLVERIAVGIMSPATEGLLYPIAITPAIARQGHNPYGTAYADTLTLYKLHGSISWYTSTDERNSDPIYGLPSDRHPQDPYVQRLVGDKRRFITPPVYDKSTLLGHESIRNLWRQAKTSALSQADNLYVIGYSLPETDMAMRTLLWQGSPRDQGRPRKIPLYVVDICENVAKHYDKMLGGYYCIMDTYAGGTDAFDKFVEEYTK